MHRSHLLLTSGLLAAALILTGCAPVDLDQVMGRTEGTAVPAPAPKLDCNLIFPPASVNP
jgi:hypothetical protein